MNGKHLVMEQNNEYQQICQANQNQGWPFSIFYCNRERRLCPLPINFRLPRPETNGVVKCLLLFPLIFERIHIENLYQLVQFIYLLL